MDFVAIFSYFQSPEPFFAILLGVLLGYFVGAMPGLSRPTALAIAIPFTYALSPLAAVALLLGVAKGSAAGGAIAAILLNVPGEPGSAATTFDGYPMAKKGEAGKALEIALYASVAGDLIATIALILVAQPMAKMALQIGPVELCALIVFSLTFVAGLAGDSLIKGVIAALAGMALATVGIDAGSGFSRMTFSNIELADGIPLIPLGVGIMAWSELMIQMRKKIMYRDAPEPKLLKGSYSDSRLSWAEARLLGPTILRSGIIGLIVGIIPGLGALMAAFICYSIERQKSKTPEEFGKGAHAGVAATETADNAATIGAFIPLLALGIPGSVTAAILLGAFTLHGLVPGPLLFQRNPDLVYAMFIALILSSGALLLVGKYGMRLFVLLVRSPMGMIIPAALTTCVIGVYVEGISAFSVTMLMIFAAIGYLMNRAWVPFVPFIIGFILGPMMELYFRQTLILTQYNLINIVNHPIALAFLMASFISIIVFLRGRKPTTSEKLDLPN
ncbi:tripartite tricarboxylate transporter permease [Sulfitobacter sp. 20_GPM-1509m]|uniref:tripartite tricarboxylate transporter permease n=1 Tax=Sulfitobacter sp. 20_GPM-1509m TaxID=1380367 RepID=UPI00048F6F3E|nr:tripartite tricarboxylate transporter permease [Sulfitobacter sp. 20_GPM-1509m]